MAHPEAMWEEFREEWENAPAELGTLYYVVKFLKALLAELQAHRPVDREPITVENHESRYPLMAGGLSRALFHQVDEEVQRRMSRVHAPRDTETIHGNRLDLVKHVAIEELNVAPQVAEYARRILMGCRPEPDRGVMDTLWSYVGQEPPEAYTLVDKGLVALNDLMEWAVKEEGVHPAAAGLARRILAGEGPTVTIHHRVTMMLQKLPPGAPAKSGVVDFNGTRTVLVVEPGVDLEQGDLGAQRTHGRVFDPQGRLIYTAVDVEAGRRAIEQLLPGPSLSDLTTIVHAVLKAVGGAFEEER
jgi:hypothetical protein